MNQQYFSDGEWATLLQTPNQAILAVILADKTDLVSFMKEVQSAFQILATELQREDISSELVRAVVTSLKDRVGQDTLPVEQASQSQQFEFLSLVQTLNNATDGQKQAIAHLQQVKAILMAKVPVTQVEAFREWILSIATQVAQVIKEEGGVFGIGGERISRAESGALSAIEEALTLKY